MTDDRNAAGGDELPAVFARLADALDPSYDVIDTMDAPACTTSPSRS